MFRLTAGDPHDLADVAAFTELLDRSDQHERASVRALFRGDAPLVVSRAPGRLDVMGGIADYSGSLVLQLPTREAALCAVQASSARHLMLVSLGGGDRAADFSCPLEELFPDGAPLPYDEAQAYFRRDQARSWAAYMAGCLLVLAHERGQRFDHGFSILVDSSVPEGKGVSSSAAIEVAVMTALCASLDLGLSPRDIAILCQTVENRVVGAPCGVMDQMTSSCGEEGRLLAILCQPAEILESIAFSDDLRVWGIDSGIRHAVTGADYGSVRCGAFMGFRMLSKLCRLPDGAASAITAPDEGRWGGYLANVTVHEFLTFADRLPIRMAGGDFLDEYHGTADDITSVDPGADYAVRAPTAHPVFEHHRIRCFAELLGAPPSERRDQLLGQLMYQSHASYGRCGLGSEGTDKLVDAVDSPGSKSKGLLGAKITGGGSGGTVAILGRPDAETKVRSLAEAYGLDTGRRPYLFQGSSPGAAQFGILRLEPS